MFAADGSFLVQSLYLTTEDNYFEGKLICEGLLLLHLLLSVAELAFITLNVGDKPHKVVLNEYRSTCCYWRAI